MVRLGQVRFYVTHDPAQVPKPWMVVQEKIGHHLTTVPSPKSHTFVPWTITWGTYLLLLESIYGEIGAMWKMKTVVGQWWQWESGRGAGWCARLDEPKLNAERVVGGCWHQNCHFRATFPCQALPMSSSFSSTPSCFNPCLRSGTKSYCYFVVAKQWLQENLNHQRNGISQPASVIQLVRTSSIIRVVMSSSPDWSENFLILHITCDAF